MKILMDTHILLWFLKGDKLLSKQAVEILRNQNNICLVSIASIWEIAIKNSLNKLNLDFPFDSLTQYLFDLNIDILPITFDHIIELTKL